MHTNTRKEERDNMMQDCLHTATPENELHTYQRHSPSRNLSNLKSIMLSFFHSFITLSMNQFISLLEPEIITVTGHN